MSTGQCSLWSHQLQAIHQASGRNCYALFFEQGCGKTATLIKILQDVYAKNGFLRTLVLCPPIVIENWKREFALFSDLPERAITTLTGSFFERAHNFEHPRNGKNEFIAVTNYEALYMDKLFQKFVDWKPQVLVVDESQKCKDPSAKRTARVTKLADIADFRYLLSGTPILRSAFDIYSQFRILDRGETFGVKFQEFKETFFTDWNAFMPRQSYFPNWQPKQGALTEINRRIYGKAIRAKKSECLDLPPFVRQEATYELDGPQDTAYRQMEKDAITYFKNEVIAADLAITQLLKLQQLASGFIANEDGKIREFDHGRPKVLNELLDSIDPEHKVIIWACFRQNYDDIKRVLERRGTEYVEVTGEISGGKKSANIDAFNRDPSVRVLLGHPASCGIGANLTAASYAIFYSRSFSLEDDLQAEARNYRGGSEIHRKITRIDIIARNTVDEVVLAALSAKSDVSETLLKYMKGKK